MLASAERASFREPFLRLPFEPWVFVSVYDYALAARAAGQATQGLTMREPATVNRIIMHAYRTLWRYRT